MITKVYITLLAFVLKQTSGQQYLNTQLQDIFFVSNDKLAFLLLYSYDYLYFMIWDHLIT